MHIILINHLLQESLNLPSLKWCSLINCNWCVSLDIVYILALRSAVMLYDILFGEIAFGRQACFWRRYLILHAE